MSDDNRRKEGEKDEKPEECGSINDGVLNCLM